MAEKRSSGKSETTDGPKFIRLPSTTEPVEARLFRPPTPDYAGYRYPSGIQTQIIRKNVEGPVITKNREPDQFSEMRLVHSSVGPYGPCDIYIVGATLMAHVHKMGWMAYGSSAPPPPGHPLRQENEKGEPLWITGTFFAPEADMWLRICMGRQQMYPDKSVLTSIHQPELIDKPS